MVVKSDPTSSEVYEIRDNDIVFLDIVMPHVNGLGVLERLAIQNSKCDIVIMSGDPGLLNKAEKLLKQLDLGHMGMLAKPFRVADVAEVLQET